MPPILGKRVFCTDLTRMPAPGFSVSSGGRLPGFVMIILGLQCAIGFGLIVTARSSIKQFRKEAAVFPAKRLQIFIWASLVCTAVVLFSLDQVIAGATTIVFMQILPRARKAKSYNHRYAEPTRVQITC